MTPPQLTFVTAPQGLCATEGSNTPLLLSQTKVKTLKKQLDLGKALPNNTDMHRGQKPVAAAGSLL